MACLRGRHINAGPFLHHHFRCIPDTAVLPLPAATNIHLTATLTAGGTDQTLFVQQDILSLNHYLTSTAPGIACRHLTGEVYHAAVPAIEDHIAPTDRGPTGLHHSTHIQDGVQQHVFTQRRQVYLPVGRAHQTTVLHGGQATAVQLQRDRFSGSQDSFPARCEYRAVVFHPVCRQNNVSTRRRGQVALVNDFCPGFRALAEGVLSLHEVFTFNVTGRGHKPGSVHAGALAKQHPVRVHQEHLTVGTQVAHDF